MHLSQLTEEEAKTISTWFYQGSYSVYNLPSWSTMCKMSYGMTSDKIRTKQFFAVYTTNLIGMGRIKPAHDGIYLAILLKPDLLNQGLGSKAFKLLCLSAQDQYPGLRLKLRVRHFNKAAIRCYEKNGFRVESSDDTYLTMVKDK